MTRADGITLYFDGSRIDPRIADSTRRTPTQGFGRGRLLQIARIAVAHTDLMAKGGEGVCMTGLEALQVDHDIELFTLREAVRTIVWTALDGNGETTPQRLERLAMA